MPRPRLNFRNVLLLLAAWVGLAVVYVTVRAPFVARKRLECVRHVFAVVNQHVKDHKGEWPRKWRDLEQVRLPASTTEEFPAWPDIREHVHVDFQADPTELAGQSPEQFEAIRANGNCRPDQYRQEVETLLATLRSFHPDKTGAADDVADSFAKP